MLEVGSSATKNHNTPYAIGRVSFCRDVTHASASAAATKAPPANRRTSSGSTTSGHWVSALKRSGRNRLTT